MKDRSISLSARSTLILLSFLAAVCLRPAYGQSDMVVVRATRHAIAPPLSAIEPEPAGASSVPVDSAWQGSQDSLAAQDLTDAAPKTLSITSGLNFLGVGNGLNGFSVTYGAPDTNGSAGPTQFVQWVNYSFAVFNKADGSLAYGPAAGQTLWKPLGGPCATQNLDPIAQFDKMANRSTSSRSPAGMIRTTRNWECGPTPTT